jgi:hypothetical protein
MPPEVLLDPSHGGNQPRAQRGPETDEDEDTRLSKDAAVQTKYRESDAQTDAYTPDYTVRPGDEPEILTLAALTMGKGLPAGLAEVQMIERARAKREFEASLPPTTDAASFLVRKEMMEEQETREWEHRESEIDRVQDERLQLLHAAIHERDQESEFLNEQRVEALRSAKLEQKDQEIAEIQGSRIKSLRKLVKGRKRAVPEPGSRKRDIIADYADYGSQVYAPRTREGRALTVDRRAGQYQGGSTHIAAGLRGLQELEQTMHPRHLTTDTSKPKRKAARSTKERKAEVVAGHLQVVAERQARRRLSEAFAKSGDKEMAAAAAAGASAGASASASSLPTWRKPVQKLQRPSTPTVGSDADADPRVEADAQALLLLQRLLRGRAAQNTMFEGKERRAELIAELRGAAEAERQQPEHPEVADARAEEQQRVLAVGSAEETAAGEVVSAALDFLSKELLRKKQLERISGTSVAAVGMRREREAEEGGRRQAQANLRARQDQMYEQSMRVHHSTAETYMEGVLDKKASEVAHDQAVREMVQGKAAREAREAAGEAEGPAEQVVGELVSGFLLPEVSRQHERERAQAEEQRFMDAAHGTVAMAVVGGSEEEQEAAASKLQASVRGSNARREVVEKKEEDAAASKLQASVRGSNARKQQSDARQA